MIPEHKKKINANYKKIVDNVDFDEIKDYLYSNVDEFTSEYMEFILSKPTKPAKMRALIHILFKYASQDVFMHLCESLRTSNIKAYQTLAEAIENTDASTVLQDYENNSPKEKITELTRYFIKQTKLMKNRDIALYTIPEFMTLSEDGDFIVNENIEKFSKYMFRNVNLRVKKDKTLPDDIKEISCQLGEDVLSSFTSPKPDKYTRAMRKLVENLLEVNKSDFSDVINNMHILEMVGFPTVEAIAKELFIEINWGRIVVWFAFWREMVNYLDGESKDFKNFGSYVGYYVSLTCEKWIIEHGGWDHLLLMSSQDNSPGLFHRLLNFITRGYYN